MKKEGEKAKAFMTHAVFILLIIMSAYFIINSTVNLTGYAVLDASSAKAKLESAIASSALFGQITQASICVIINDPEQPISLQASQYGSGWQVSEMKDFCAGTAAEDIIIQFPNYDSFSKVVDDPSPRNIANGAINRDYEILPSRYIEMGGNVLCDATFKVKFCGAASTMTTTQQLIDGDLACCIDQMTSAERKQLEQHLAEGNFRDEMGILEQASPGILGFSMTASIIILGGVLVLVILVAVIALGKGKKPAAPPKPAQASEVKQPTGPQLPRVGPMQQTPPPEPAEITELRNYVRQAMGEGYGAEDIKTHLLEIGWDTLTADRILAEVQQGR